jgi:hypothetical protein
MGIKLGRDGESIIEGDWEGSLGMKCGSVMKSSLACRSVNVIPSRKILSHNSCIFIFEVVTVSTRRRMEINLSDFNRQILLAWISPKPSIQIVQDATRSLREIAELLRDENLTRDDRCTVIHQ